MLGHQRQGRVIRPTEEQSQLSHKQSGHLRGVSTIGPRSAAVHGLATIETGFLISTNAQEVPMHHLALEFQLMAALLSFVAVAIQLLYL